VGHAEERVVEFLRLALDRDEKIRSLPGVGFRDAGGAAVINPVKITSPMSNGWRGRLFLMDVAGYLKQTSKDYQFNSDRRRRRSFPLTVARTTACSAPRARSAVAHGLPPVDDVLDEIELLKSRHGVENLVFIDDCLLASRPASKRF